MKKVSSLIILLLCISVVFSQNKPIGKKGNSYKSKKVSISVKKSDSFISWIWMNEVSVTNNGGLFVGGSFDGKGLFLKIINGNLEAKTLSFINEITHIFFINNQTGWIADNNFLYRTVDGGESWAKDLPVSINKEGSMFFLDERLGWFIGADHTIYKIEDSNKVQKITDVLNREIRTKQLHFVNAKNGWRTYYGDDTSGFEQTKDGGITWDEVNSQTAEYISDFQLLNENEVFFENSVHEIYYTEDGGNNWSPIKLPSKKIFTEFFFLDKNTGWVGGKEICRTMNGGTNWICNSSPTKYNIKKIVFLNSNEGWLMTFDNLYSTTDGGKTWRKRLEVELSE